MTVLLLFLINVLNFWMQFMFLKFYFILKNKYEFVISFDYPIKKATNQLLKGNIFVQLLCYA